VVQTLLLVAIFSLTGFEVSTEYQHQEEHQQYTGEGVESINQPEKIEK
jgi:hypothetical protein